MDMISDEIELASGKEHGDAAYDLISAVAVSVVQASVNAHPHECALFSIAGLSSEETSAIARRLHGEMDGVEVWINPALSDGRLPPHMISTETAAHWRNRQRANDARAIVFAVPTASLDTVGETLGAVWRLSTETLLEQLDHWVNALPNLSKLEKRWREYLLEALAGLTASDVVLDLVMFARFMQALDARFEETTLEKAMDHALPELRLPRGAGRFKGPGARGRLPRAKRWEADFREIARNTQPKLRLTNDRGVPLDRQALHARVDELVSDNVLDEHEADTVRRFIDDKSIEPGSWTDAQRELAHLDWSRVEPVFKAGGRRTNRGLGEATASFFDRNYPDRLSDTERETLELLTNEMGDPNLNEREFFFEHREVLQEEPKLYKKWERYIFRRNERCDDLLSGLMSAIGEVLRQDEAPSEPRVLVRLVQAGELKFWRNHNTDLCCLLRDRYRGLGDLVAPEIELDFGLCWSRDWESDLDKRNQSTSRAAREFKFEVYLLSGDDRSQGALRAAPKAQVIWALPAEAVARALPSDLREVGRIGASAEQAMLLKGMFARTPRSERAQDAPISLEDRNGLVDAHGMSDGNLANANHDQLDIGRHFLENLRTLEAEGVVTKDQAIEFAARYNDFLHKYTLAVRALIKPDGCGLADDALLDQAEAYGALLHTLRQHARAPRSRDSLWRPLLELGIAQSSDSTIMAIVTPWQPLRLAELAVKARHFARWAKAAMAAQPGNDLDMKVYFEVAASALSAPYYPEVALWSNPTQDRLLSTVEHLGDYDLLEPPTEDQGAKRALDGGTRKSVEHFLAVVEEYLTLQPHERANFSAVIYNAESADLPGKLTQELARKVERESDLRCDLILTHEDHARLRDIYAEQNVAIGHEIDGALSSEATRTFLSRLRVGLLEVDQAYPANNTRRDVDVVLLQDVISRRARVDWRPPTGQIQPRLVEHNPIDRSRRCARDVGATSTAVYLTTPTPPGPVQAYLDLLHDILKKENGPASGSWVPVREIPFIEGQVHETIERAHAIGEWVVTYDAIADRRLLEENGIRIIRHLTHPGGGHNLIVSTVVPGRSLQRRLSEEIERLISCDPQDSDGHATNCINRAANISGRVVLQAAHRETRAFELIGLVLSREAAQVALGDNVEFVATLLLDDFGTWLGHREGELADLLLIGLRTDTETPTVEVVVVEGKCVNADDVSNQARKSRRQLQLTMQNLRSRLGLNGEGAPLLAQGIWRRRIADVLLEHADRFAAVGDLGPGEWADAIRSGEAQFRLHGRSFVFVHDGSYDEGSTELCGEGSLQRIFSTFETRGALKDVLLTGASTILRPKLTDESDSAPQVTSGKCTESVDQTLLSAATPAPSPADPSVEVSDGQSVSALEETTPVQTGLPAPIEAWARSRASASEDEAAERWLELTVQRLQRALRNYGMDCKVVGSRLTPNAALVRFEGSDNLTVPLVERRRQELLTTHAIDVIAVLPGKGEVHVMVARDQRAVLRLEHLWLQRQLPESAPVANSSLLIGAREDNGEMLYLNLGGAFAGQPQHGPHTLIAGETGSGKGVLTQALLLDIAATNSPSNARIRLIDPKAGADFGWIHSLPHLDGEIVTDQARAVQVFAELVDEMEQRYQIITQAGTPNIDRYNRKVPLDQQLPRIFFFHDEMGDWMADKDNAQYRDAVESYVVRLASKARAAGIHLFLITQRPDKDALPSQIKANMNNKLCLRVSSGINSRIVLDEVGAENLLGQGHLAAKLANERGSSLSSLILAQVPFADEDVMFELAGMIGSYWSDHQ